MVFKDLFQIQKISHVSKRIRVISYSHMVKFETFGKKLHDCNNNEEEEERQAERDREKCIFGIYLQKPLIFFVSHRR